MGLAVDSGRRHTPVFVFTQQRLQRYGDQILLPLVAGVLEHGCLGACA